MKLNISYKVVLSVVVLFIITIIIIGGVIIPTIKYIDKMEKDSYELMVYLEKRYDSVVKLRKSMRNFDEISKGVEDFRPLLFNEGDELKLITTLEDIATKNNIKQTIDSANWGKQANGQKIVSLTTEGDYKNLIKYLADIEKSKYFLHIKMIQLTPTFNRRGEHTNNALLHINISFYANS